MPVNNASIPSAFENSLTVTSNGQTVFTLTSAPSDNSTFNLFLNGQRRFRGTDYTQSGTALTWLDPAGLTLTTTDEVLATYNSFGLGVSSKLFNVTTVSTTPYNIASSDEVILVDCTIGTITLNAPVIANSRGRVIRVIKIDSTSNQWLFDPAGAETVNGRSSYEKSHQFDAYEFVGGTTEWQVSGEFEAVAQKFYAAEYDTTMGDFRVQRIGASAAFPFTFSIPSDFEEIVTLAAIVIPSAGAAGAGRDIDLTSDFGALGELFNANSQSDTTTTYDFTGLTNTLTTINLAPVFSGVAAGDYCGVTIDHNGIGGTIDYLGILLLYKR